MVDQHDEELKIRAIAKPRSLLIARQLLLMRSNGVWNLKSSDGGEINPTLLPKNSTAVLDVVLNQSKYQREYKISVAGVGGFETTNSYLVTFEEK